MRLALALEKVPSRKLLLRDLARAAEVRHLVRVSSPQSEFSGCFFLESAAMATHGQPRLSSCAGSAVKPYPHAWPSLAEEQRAVAGRLALALETKPSSNPILRGCALTLELGHLVRVSSQLSELWGCFFAEFVVTVTHGKSHCSSWGFAGSLAEQTPWRSNGVGEETPTKVQKLQCLGFRFCLEQPWKSFLALESVSNSSRSKALHSRQMSEPKAED
mmetsp:Transcript_55995/g.88736  ORF Transcript_55995/g.88736 Transcript_55995/m.88736 type:complete len:217 (-) Transcript_55995:128-778(-)